MLPDGVYKTLVIILYINLLIKSQLTIIKRLKKLIGFSISTWFIEKILCLNTSSTPLLTWGNLYPFDACVLVLEA